MTRTEDSVDALFLGAYFTYANHPLSEIVTSELNE